MTIRKIDIFRTGFRTFFIQSLWNYESLLAYGIAFSILPILTKLYSKRDIIRKGREYLSYFNSQPYLAAFILGMLIKLEEDAVENSIDNNLKISSIKASYMGPLAAMGDSFFWWCLKPTTLIITIFLVMYFNDFTNAFLFLFFFLIFFNAFHLYYRFGSISYGYKYGEDGLKFFQKFNMNLFQKGMFQITFYILGISITMLVLKFPFPKLIDNIEIFKHIEFQIFYGISVILLFFVYRLKRSPLLLILTTLIIIFIFSFLKEKNLVFLRIN